ncbi:MAG TPA: hypothetical protein ENJ19_07880 [Gammaproteobacteria bacterium]|nr:hypothetical protein [Gammaproteobacteria bacterium]
MSEYLVPDPLDFHTRRFTRGSNGHYDKNTVPGRQDILHRDRFGGTEIRLWKVFKAGASATD